MQWKDACAAFADQIKDNQAVNINSLQKNEIVSNIEISLNGLDQSESIATLNEVAVAISKALVPQGLTDDQRVIFVIDHIKPAIESFESTFGSLNGAFRIYKAAQNASNTTTSNQLGIPTQYLQHF